MDRITGEQQEAIKRASTERLRARLEQAGWSSENATALSRTELMDAVAELYVLPTDEVAAVY